MAKIRLDADHTLVDGESLTFHAPCHCNDTDGLIIYYPDANGNEVSKEFVFKDAHGNNLSGLVNAFVSGAYVKVVLNTNYGYAFIQNADTNAYLEAKFETKAEKDHAHTAADVGAVPTVAVYYNNEMNADDLVVPLAVIKVSDTSNAELRTVLGSSQSYAYVRTHFYRLSTVNSRIQTAFSYTGTPVKMAIRMFNQNDKVWTPWREVACTDYALPRDGSAAMTGNLSINNGTASVVSLIPYGGQLIVRNELDSANRQDLAFGQGTLRFLDTVNSVTNAYNILHTGNMESLLSSHSKILTGSYSGTGTSGIANPNSIAYPDNFNPVLVLLISPSDKSVRGVWIFGEQQGLTYLGATARDYVNLTWEQGCVSWYAQDNDPIHQFNVSSKEYNWFIIGY